eukprot:c17226_g1_i1.p1 GENE.c17226_g1_i1~~c17226_g1_i1.p1  ORF type:complete len:544 (+),score=116.93 c17226_g1_i1:133-1632(+)
MSLALFPCLGFVPVVSLEPNGFVPVHAALHGFFAFTNWRAPENLFVQVIIVWIVLTAATVIGFLVATALWGRKTVVSVIPRSAIYALQFVHFGLITSALFQANRGSNVALKAISIILLVGAGAGLLILIPIITRFPNHFLFSCIAPVPHGTYCATRPIIHTLVAIFLVALHTKPVPQVVLVLLTYVLDLCLLTMLAIKGPGIAPVSRVVFVICEIGLLIAPLAKSADNVVVTYLPLFVVCCLALLGLHKIVQMLRQPPDNLAAPHSHSSEMPSRRRLSRDVSSPRETEVGSVSFASLFGPNSSPAIPELVRRLSSELLEPKKPMTRVPSNLQMTEEEVHKVEEDSDINMEHLEALNLNDDGLAGLQLEKHFLNMPAPGEVVAAAPNEEDEESTENAKRVPSSDDEPEALDDGDDDEEGYDAREAPMGPPPASKVPPLMAKPTVDVPVVDQQQSSTRRLSSRRKPPRLRFQNDSECHGRLFNDHVCFVADDFSDDDLFQN